MIRNVAVLGATGAMGVSTLDAIGRHPGPFRASVLAVDRDVEALANLCALHRPDLAIIADPALEAELTRRLAAAGVRCDVASGHDAITLASASTRCDTVVAAIAGMTSLDACAAATKAGKRLLLTHRASGAVAGPLLLRLAEGGGELIPVDTERNAICPYPSTENTQRNRGGLRKLILTTSGGPFHGHQRAALTAITPEQICKHANPSKDRRAMVDSATLMNAGLAVIEAHHLSGLSLDQIAVQVQPQSQLHSLAEYADGSLLARFGHPELPTAMAHAMAGPERIDGTATPLDPIDHAYLAHEKPDTKTFRCLALAFQVLRTGGDASTILNAANEVAVAAFLAGTLPFLSIADVIEQVLTELPPQAAVDIQTLSERDRTAREAARQVLRNAC